MNKQELVASVAGGANLTKKQAEEAVSAVFASIADQIVKGNSVSLVGFGTFSAAHRAAREGVNPRTGERIKVAARILPKFAPGKALKEAANAKKSAPKKAAAKPAAKAKK